METWKYESSKLARKRYYIKNKVKITARTKEYQKNNPHIVKKSKLKGLYGITFEQYEQMRQSQKGLCAICSGSGPLVVDHCHITNKVRGLLCAKCNTGLGMFRDELVNVQSALRYLEKSV